MTSYDGNDNNLHEPEIEIQFTTNEKASQQILSSEVSDQVLVVIKKIAKDYIDEYAATDTSRELGGVLIGSYEEIGSRYIVNISAAIKARYTDATLAEIKFTHQTWEDIDKVKESYYPDEKIIGWFHTHPGFGIFLSDYDLFIQNNFFKFPHQVAYVVDPIKGKSGFFGNAEGTIKRIKYQIEEPRASTVRSKSKVSAYSKKKKKPWFSIFKMLLVVAIVLGILSTYFFGIEPVQSLKRDHDELEAMHDKLQAEHDKLQVEHDKLRAENADLNERIKNYQNDVNRLMTTSEPDPSSVSTSPEEPAETPESEAPEEYNEQPLSPPGEEENEALQNNEAEQ